MINIIINIQNNDYFDHAASIWQLKKGINR